MFCTAILWRMRLSSSHSSTCGLERECREQSDTLLCSILLGSSSSASDEQTEDALLAGGGGGSSSSARLSMSEDLRREVDELAKLEAHLDSTFEHIVEDIELAFGVTKRRSKPCTSRSLYSSVGAVHAQVLFVVESSDLGSEVLSLP